MWSPVCASPPGTAIRPNGARRIPSPDSFATCHTVPMGRRPTTAIHGNNWCNSHCNRARAAGRNDCAIPASRSPRRGIGGRSTRFPTSFASNTIGTSPRTPIRRFIPTRNEGDSSRVVWRSDATQAFPRISAGARSRLPTRDELHSTQVGITWRSKPLRREAADAGPVLAPRHRSLTPRRPPARPPRRPDQRSAQCRRAPVAGS